MPSACLVTGGAGFIGSSLVRALLARGDRVRVIDNFFSGKRENLAEVAGDIELLEGDIRDEAAVARACAGVELRVPPGGDPLGAPVAGRSARQQRREHHRTLKVLWEADARRASAGSSTPPRRPPTATHPTLPKIETMRRRRCRRTRSPSSPASCYCQVFARAYRLETVALRYFNVFGARQDPKSEYAAVIPRFVTAGLAGPGVDDLRRRRRSRATSATSRTPSRRTSPLRSPRAKEVSGRVFNIACGAATTLNDVVRLIGETLGQRNRDHLRPLARRRRQTLAGGHHRRADPPRLQGRRVVPEGLNRTIAWYREARR